MGRVRITCIATAGIAQAGSFTLLLEVDQHDLIIAIRLSRFKSNT
jgi:hypothetical protein